MSNVINTELKGIEGVGTHFFVHIKVMPLTSEHEMF